MKLKLIAFLAVLVFTSIGIVGVAHAHEDEIGRCNIPFDFYAGKQKMPAGHYSIRIDLETKVFSFTDESGHKVFVIGMSGDKGDGKSLLMFKYSGDAYALEELESETYNWAFQTWMPVPSIESRNASSHVEVALNQ
jgi:hypothetical protein